MKIHIIGGSGTGKSWLARGLSEQYHIPHYDLDDLQWDNTADSYGVKTPPEERDARLNDILDRDDWIIEGVYYKWVRRSFEEADRIYVLEAPRHVSRYRIIKRFVKRKFGLEPGKRETLKSLGDLLKWSDRFREVNLKEIKRILEPYEGKVVFVNSGKEARSLLEM